jgi:hypothetical protein
MPVPSNQKCFGRFFFSRNEPRRVVRTKEIFYILKSGSLGSGTKSKFGGELIHIEFCH